MLLSSHGTFNWCQNLSGQLSRHFVPPILHMRKMVFVNAKQPEVHSQNTWPYQTSCLGWFALRLAVAHLFCVVRQLWEKARPWEFGSNSPPSCLAHRPTHAQNIDYSAVCFSLCCFFPRSPYVAHFRSVGKYADSNPGADNSDRGFPGFLPSFTRRMLG